MLRSSVLGCSLAVTFVALGAVTACGTDNGEDPYTSPVPSAVPSGAKDAGTTRPPFSSDSGTTTGADGGPTSGTTDSGAKDSGAPDPGEPDPPDPGQCIDENDPGGTEPLAKVLADTDDNQDHDITIKGVLKGQGDVDFFKFSMSDKAGHTTDTSFATPTKGVEMCVWLACKKGNIEDFGCKGGVEDNTLAARKGCCVTGPGAPNPTWACKGGGFNQQDDSANFVVRIRQTADECLPYAWSYKF